MKHTHFIGFSVAKSNKIVIKVIKVKNFVPVISIDVHISSIISNFYFLTVFKQFFLLGI